MMTDRQTVVTCVVVSNRWFKLGCDYVMNLLCLFVMMMVRLTDEERARVSLDYNVCRQHCDL